MNYQRCYHLVHLRQKNLNPGRVSSLSWKKSDHVIPMVLFAFASCSFITTFLPLRYLAAYCLSRPVLGISGYFLKVPLNYGFSSHF